MEYLTKNRYTVYFKDGSSFDSNGSATNYINKSPVDNEFKWVSFHIQKEVLQKGKTLEDIKRIEYILEYKD
jgi:hypothetical protein